MSTKDNLVRFGVAMESSLIDQLDALAAERGCNRSELLRDLTRAEVSRSALADKVPAFAAVTLVYNHHVRELSERLTMLQHDLGEAVRSSMHVHLNHEHCLEVIVMRGRSDHLKEATGRMIGTRGVIQGGAEFVAEDTLRLGGTGRRVHRHDGQEPHSHPTPHLPGHAHAHSPAKALVLKQPVQKKIKKPGRVVKARVRRGAS
ncbi:MAG: nickel-responsive transcriptional regulator NikR [Pseudomonadota bacterium]